jgi:hypothetical protein
MGSDGGVGTVGIRFPRTNIIYNFRERTVFVVIKGGVFVVNDVERVGVVNTLLCEVFGDSTNPSREAANFVTVGRTPRGTHLRVVVECKMHQQLSKFSVKDRESQWLPLVAVDDFRRQPVADEVGRIEVACRDDEQNLAGSGAVGHRFTDDAYGHHPRRWDIQHWR